MEDNARAIAKEIQQINDEIQALLIGQKSLISDAIDIPEATDAFADLTQKIMEDIRKRIAEIIQKTTQQGKNEAEILAHVTKAIEIYQDVTIPQKMDMLATHFNGKLSEMNLREKGESSYIWVSMDDKKVRPSHAANDGKQFRWDSPPDTAHPGEDYNCRCQAAPIQVAGLGRIGLDFIKNALKKPQSKIKTAAKKVKKSKIQPSTNNPKSLRGKSLKEVEKLADKELLKNGWKKEPLKKGDGIRYTNGKGGSFEINKGYPKNNIGDDIHKGPYIKTTVGNKKIRVPLKDNPDL